MSADTSSLFGGVAPLLPPSNIPAEQALLGAMLANNKAYNAVSGYLRPEMFADPINGRIFQAAARRIEAGQLADALTLKTEFENSGILSEVGGVTYLTKLLSAMVGIINAGEYGRVVHDTWARRQLIELGEAMIQSAYGTVGSTSAVEQISLLQDEIVTLEAAVGTTDGTPPRGATTTAYDAFMAAVERAEGITRGEIERPYSTGLPAVDRMLGGGIGPDMLYYMVGAGEMGKTELALQIAENVAEQAYESWVAGGQVGPCPGVLYIMLGNMNATQLGARMAARYGGMRLSLIRKGEIDLESGLRLAEAGKQVVRLPLEISDVGPPTLARVLGDMRRFAKRRPLVLTVIDNFSDMLSMFPDRMFGTAISITPALKTQGATPTQSAVMLLMHMNSSSENSQKRSPRPRPSDIPWGTKKDADAAIGVWRPVRYEEPEPPTLASKRLTPEGKELEAKMFKEWSDKREPWPIGLADISEVVPMKLREQDGNEAIAKLRFDRNLHRFIDVEDEKRAGASPYPEEEDAF
jgi:replicative DNA helicase